MSTGQSKRKAKPCPYCNGVKLRTGAVGRPEGDGFQVECKTRRCLATGPFRLTVTAARAAWNERRMYE